ncbi:septum site-determining protein MinC [Dethiobacter alkaliphilus]|uniref:Probable septum site-determining protein MinC n=1 Tax=Dethiobacter alkaliphilus AHT 1 TaxID=555088 RepID=C0GEW0_DETAL|nr:septum site-determining protein MinC [Dethiobacter alkaliphilus]EEG78142.1 septum site-determining protein MinC [Dethiobacter alkaliphilus AHT 1]
MNKYSVEFKGTKDGVTIYCLESAGFDEILSDLTERLKQRAAFFAEAEVRVDIGNRILTEHEKEQLAQVIAENSKLQLTGIQTTAQRPPTVSSAKRRGETEDIKMEGFKEGRSLVIKRTLRSGQGVHFPGNVTVLGDVNPGAEIVAEGDIYVFGTLRGIAHAGAGGDRSASVVALRLAPTQLRIADIISRAPDDSALPDQPEYAYISDNRIMIAAISIKLGS